MDLGNGVWKAGAALDDYRPSLGVFILAFSAEHNPVEPIDGA